MCYSGNLASGIYHGDLVVRRRWYALQANMVVEMAAAEDNHAHATSFVVREGGGGGGGGSEKRYCLCSPTRHPGSFRCRQHLGEYTWGGVSRVMRRRFD